MKIVLIGAGNVATQLGLKLVEVGEEIVQVFSRSILNAGHLANELGAKGYTNALEGLLTSADIYIIAVNDSAIGEVANTLEGVGIRDKLVVHTSGATPMQTFKDIAPKLERVGVFYPLQTFSKNKQADFSQIPFCLDAGSVDDIQLLKDLAGKISDQVFTVDDAQRATLHLAAVFVNNFSNHCYSIGEKIMKESNLPFGILLPLIRETVAKLENGSPKEMQTGPAIRHDELTIQRHLRHLETDPPLQEIYRLMTKHIQGTT